MSKESILDCLEGFELGECGWNFESLLGDKLIALCVDVLNQKLAATS